jgi:hypothetical protein
VIPLCQAEIAKRPLVAQSCRSRACPFLRCRLNGVRKPLLNLSAGGSNCKESRFFPKASAKSVGEFETFLSVACLWPGFADVAERPAVHDWKFATRVDRLNGH